ncbi:hypothetical protein [Roseomonas marmotae]|uniref:Uncharacterized protein n=1 Tax=Roseomonas marmotae TaxID=2768161 RepID=A0ABS3KA35_9PROT|nr:hypothetical protein [Roseomonas marmotae]MBO1073892.1 hypothetical protein [Roseomonas marmotae]QTI78488.1 hypothetical protein IAI58_12455 [Roseomonas marmotae]
MLASACLPKSVTLRGEAESPSYALRAALAERLMRRTPANEARSVLDVDNLPRQPPAGQSGPPKLRLAAG